MDVPGYPTPLLITDAAINIAPTLEEKADIIRNAIDLAHVIGMDVPAVAILAAVETVNPAMPPRWMRRPCARWPIAGRSPARCSMARWPSTMPSARRRRGKGHRLARGGQADILVVPNLEAGNMLAKQLTFLGGADAAGIVLGARVPIILTSRADAAHAAGLLRGGRAAGARAAARGKAAS
jgi:phosphotransacetylase